MKRKIVILLTGGIGSGKTTITKYLKNHYGIPTFYSDDRAKELYNDPQILNEVNEIVGGGIIRNNALDKKALASIIFNPNNKETRRRLEYYIYPKVIEQFNLWAEEQTTPIVIIESATILHDNRSTFDYVVFVDATKEERIKRAINRDHSTREEILERMNVQNLNKSLADYIINNENDFHSSVDEFFSKLLE